LLNHNIRQARIYCVIIINFRLAKIAEVKSKLQGSGGFREGLKSTGQQKFSIDEKEEGV